ncbi:uncharacterized protein LOC101861202 [Aplysia californica]|uniref:Uncharacterized protein LOC101861202 n=1 Tax=Aplysia californica TaxID=6500 RepID=A0ABM0JKM9_APLCA|nr:uncharacterized protein LOC101861202 [Aplysia californica]
MIVRVVVIALCFASLVSSRAQGPPLSEKLQSRVKRNEVSEVPLPPGGNPPPLPEITSLGYRCPFPPNEDGRWPEFCYDVIGEQCECKADDVIFGLRQCVTDHGDLFDRLIQIQLSLEVERDNKRLELGMEADPQPYLAILQCQSEGLKIRKEMQTTTTTESTTQA